MAKSGTLQALIATNLTTGIAAAAKMTPVDLRAANATGEWPSMAAYNRARRAAKYLAAEAQG